MLNTLLDSKLKKRLLNLFFSFPGRSFSLPELKQMLQANKVPAESALRELWRGRVVDMMRRGERRYYRLNPHLQWYSELMNLVADEKVAKQDLVSKRLAKLKGVKLIVLSGVFTFQPHSPVDVLFVAERLGSKKLAGILKTLEKLSGQEVNYSVMNQEEFEYRRLLNDRFIRDILDGPYLVVVNKIKKLKL